MLALPLKPKMIMDELNEFRPQSFLSRGRRVPRALVATFLLLTGFWAGLITADLPSPQVQQGTIFINDPASMHDLVQCEPFTGGGGVLGLGPF